MIQRSPNEHSPEIGTTSIDDAILRLVTNLVLFSTALSLYYANNQ